MNKTPGNKRGWRILRRVLVTLAVLATLIAIFYTEEDWRGKRAWENCRRKLEAQGAVFDGRNSIPPPVPEDQNIFKAPITNSNGRLVIIREADGTRSETE